MAFRAPTLARSRLQTTSYATAEQLGVESGSQITSHQPQHDVGVNLNLNVDDVVDDAQEWILFSPSQAAASTTTRTRSDSTERTARTIAVSRLSDFGSFNAATNVESRDGISVDALDEEATELDSLDDGLPDFRDPNLPDSRNHHPVLPTHDGLGSFQASGQEAQEQIWRHEQYNPQRTSPGVVHAPGPILADQEATAEERLQSIADRERWQRIEKWRTEQSRILLQEIERGTRRRQRRGSKGGSIGTTSHRTGKDLLSSISETKAADTSSSSSDTVSTQGDDSQQESIWRRITRKVIRDLIGIDDSILSVIFGESLVDETHLTSYIDEDAHPNVREMQEALRDIPTIIDDTSDTDLWQQRLLHRIARELGILVHQIWEHPGTFSTHRRPIEPSEFYAGMPVTNTQPSVHRNGQSTWFTPSPPASLDTNAFSTASPQFHPTLQPDRAAAEHNAEWGIDDGDITKPADSPVTSQDPVSAPAANQEYEYWEQSLDLPLIFRYLKNRFRRADKSLHTSSKPNTNNPNTTTTTATIASGSAQLYSEQDTSNRAAVIRQHHPLVARAHARSQARQLGLRAQMRAAGITTPTSPISRHHYHHHHHHNSHQTNRFGRRPGSSCASQSTKLSVKRTHTGLGGSGSSRHYWDIGGSVGSGSAAVSVGGATGVGVWGEV